MAEGGGSPLCGVLMFEEGLSLLCMGKCPLESFGENRAAVEEGKVGE